MAAWTPCLHVREGEIKNHLVGEDEDLNFAASASLKQMDLASFVAVASAFPNMV
jgi:hypothetical protein